MTGKLLKALSCGLFFAVLSSGPVWAKTTLPAGYLTAKELSRLVYNTTAEVEFGKAKSKGVIYFSPNGELKLIKNDQLYKGKWKVKKNDRLCTKLEGSDWECRAVVKKKKSYRQYVIKKDGKHRREMTYKKFHPGKKLTELQRAPLLPRGTLTAKQVKKLFAGKTVTSITVKMERKSLSYYAPDGTVEQLRNGKKRFGKWRTTESGRICLKMEDLKEKCRIVVKEGGKYKKYIVKKNGHHLHSVSYQNFAAGNRL